MKEHRNLWVYLAVYAAIMLGLFLWMDITISNGYQRSVAGAFVSESVKDGSLLTTDFASIAAHFTEGHRHYKIFSGIAEWEPLQLILLTISFFIFGTNKFAFTIAPLAITIATLVYLYFVALLAYEKKKHVALLAVVLASLSTFFLYEAASPMLENGLALFTFACIYHFTRWLRESENKQFYLLCFFFGLGLLWKLPVVLVLPSLAVAFIMHAGWKRKLTQPNTYKLIAIGLLIIFAVVTPMIVRDAALASQDLDRTSGRNIGRLPYFLPQDYNQQGWLTAADFEFQYGLPQYKLELIQHRYELSYAQKAVVALTSTFFNWIIVPFMLFSIFLSRKRWRNFSDVEIMLGIFFIVNLIFYSTYGLIPRYMIPATIIAVIFAARGLLQLKPKYHNTAIAVTIVLLVATSAVFLCKVYKNDHIQSMQHDYDSAAAFMLERADSEFTVVTTRQYQMAFYFLKHDDSREAYVELAPDTQASLVQLLNGNFSRPELIEDVPVAYNATLPAVRFVVVHERVETGPQPGLADYNIKEFMDQYPGATRTEIPSRFPNSRTWVYELQ